MGCWPSLSVPKDGTCSLAPPALGTYIFGDRALQPAFLLQLGKKWEAQQRWPQPRSRGKGTEPAAVTGIEGPRPPPRSPRPPSAGRR